MREKLIYYFSAIGFILSLYIFYSQFKPTDVINFNSNIPKPLVNLKFEGAFLKFNFINKEDYAVQIIRFNRLKPDTILVRDNFYKEKSLNENLSLFSKQTSPKWKPVIGKLNSAFVYGVRYVSTYSREAGEWTYVTKFKINEKLPIVSIFLDPESLFGFNKGIYTTGITQLMETNKSAEGKGWWLNAANWNNRGAEWERNAAFSFLINEKLMYQSKAGIRINGNATRGFCQKSFKLIARNSENKKSFNYSFFCESASVRYKSLLLRNSGNDWGKTMIADAFIQSLIPYKLIDRQGHLQVKVYINGLFWGLYDLCEKLDENYLSNKYQIKKKKIILMEGDEMEYGDEVDKFEYKKLVDFCETNDLSVTSNFRTFCQKADIHNLALYYAIQLYIVNVDWPNMNVKAYRFKSDQSKWKWAIRDLDCSYSYSGNSAHEADQFKFLLNNKSTMGIIFKACMKNREFRKILAEKFNFILKNIFEEGIQHTKLIAITNTLRPEITLQSNRWRKPESLEKWEKNIEGFSKFIHLRSKFILIQMKKYLQN